MIVRPVGELGAKCADTLSAITPWQAQKLADDKFEGVFVYAQVVTRATIDAVLGAGMWVGFVLEGLAASTVPTADLGRGMAANGSARLRSLGVPRGVTVFSDLENPGHPPDAWIAFADAAADATRAAGDVPGHYVGDGLGLTSAQLYALRGERYAKGASRIVDANDPPQLAEPVCSWCWVQGFPMDVRHAGSGLTIDIGAVWRDYRGRAVSVASAT